MTEENTQARQVTSQTNGSMDRSEAMAMEKKGLFKGGLAMIICCVAPLLVLGTVTLFGISLGAFASGFVSLAALLACPVGMYLMMRMMTKQNAGKAKDGDN
jgi:Flp pilus assembly protein TadB